MTSGLRAGLYVVSAMTETSGFGILAIQEQRRRRRARAAQERLRKPDLAGLGGGTGYMALIRLDSREKQQADIDITGARRATLSLVLFVGGSIVGLLANLI